MDSKHKNNTPSNAIAPHKSLAMRGAIQQGLLDANKPSLVLVNNQGIHATANALISAFPKGARHCFAVKSNPYLNILKTIREAGMGAEVASSPELELALKAGFNSDQIIFDAPVKTLQEIERALSLGIAFNIDNFQELDRVANWLKSNKSTSDIGFRINPQIGAGALASTSTATQSSKFGIGLNDGNNLEKLIHACKKHPWINTIHVHVGSVACPISLMCEGILVAVKLAEDINQSINSDQINKLDIGGGLPVDFTQDNDNPSFEQYVTELQEKVPSLFSGKYHITTEFGRAILAKNSITLGRVEYTKSTGGQAIALTHIGVQTLTRTVYDPVNFKRRISAFDKRGILKTTKNTGQDIAGPACFTGDLIAKNRKMPLLEPDDYIMVHDTGAYHYSNHYQYNALPRLPVYAYYIDTNNQVRFECISPGQTIEDVIADYS